MTKKNFDPDATFEANRSNYLESLDAILNEWFPRSLNEDNIRWNQKLDRMDDKTRRDITKATGIMPLAQQEPHYTPPHKENSHVRVNVRLVGDLTLPKELKHG